MGTAKKRTKLRDLLAPLILVWKSLIREVTARRFALFSVAFPLALRTIPEILAGPWPLGFDTVWTYAPFVKEVEARGLGSAFASFFGMNHPAPLVYILLGLGAAVTDAPPFAITKAAAPLLYGFLGLSLYYFGRRGLQWDQRKSLYLVLVTTLYFVPLRFSWDMYKNLLGYAFFLLALAHFRRSGTYRDRAVFLSLAGLSILSSELTAILLGAIALAFSASDIAKKRIPAAWVLVIVGAAAMAILLYLGLLFPAPAVLSPLAPLPSVSLFPYGYVGASQDLYVYPTLGDVYLAVLLLSGMVLGPLLPWAIVGFFREWRMTVWTATLVVGSFSIVLWPFGAIPFWHRWVFMLVFPLLVFATQGVLRTRRSSRAAFLVLLTLLATTFIVLPPQYAFPYYSDSRTTPYVQSSMMQNTVPLSDAPDVVAAIQWLNGNHHNNSVLVAHLSFIGWAELYIEGMPAYGFVDPSQILHGNFTSFAHVFLLYWAPQQGWYRSGLVPEDATEEHRVGRISVYELFSQIAPAVE